MAEVEDVAGASGGESQNFSRAGFQFLPVGEKQDGIEISLHGTAMVEIAPTFIERDAPIEADDVGSGFIHRGQQRGAVGAKINYRCAGFLQALDHGCNMRQNVAAIIFNAEAADPAIENLNDVGAGTDLSGRVFGGDVDQLAHQLIPVSGRVVHHFLGVEIVARAAAFDHVAGEGEGSSAETDDGNFSCKMFRNQGDRFGDITKFGSAVGAELGYIFFGADGLLDDRTFSGGKMEGQAHDFERKQKVGEDDGGVDSEKFGGGDGDFGGEFGLLADFEQGMLLANGAVLRHVASGLAHEPDGSTVDRLRFAGANEDGIGSRHGWIRWTDYCSIFEGARARKAERQVVRD